MRQLWPYIWPHDRFDLKLRVALAVVLMVTSKVLNLGIAFAIGWTTDALVAGSNTSAVPYAGLLGGAAGLAALYVGLRIATSLVSQGQNALFAAVAMNAVPRGLYVRCSATCIRTTWTSPGAQDRRTARAADAAQRPSRPLCARRC